MPAIQFTQALKRFFPDLRSQATEQLSIPEILDELDQKYPGLKGYILDDQGQLRQHVNIFVDGRMIRDRIRLSDPVEPGTEIYIMQALSGG